jgi:hypothetical protein
MRVVMRSSGSALAERAPCGTPSASILLLLAHPVMGNTDTNTETDPTRGLTPDARLIFDIIPIGQFLS